MISTSRASFCTCADSAIALLARLDCGKVDIASLRFRDDFLGDDQHVAVVQGRPFHYRKSQMRPSKSVPGSMRGTPCKGMRCKSYVLAALFARFSPVMEYYHCREGVRPARARE